MLIPVLDFVTSDFPEKLFALRSRLHSTPTVSGPGGLDVPGIVRGIIAEVSSQGDQAVARLVATLDRAPGISSANLQVSKEELAAAHAAADPAFLALMREAIANIRAYQQQILVPQPAPLIRGGRSLGLRYTPLDRVAVYVPGGKALYPSSVLMTVVPAQVAGVKEIVLASPPTGGAIDPMVLALAAELGVTEVWRMGGAVAVAALALGTKQIQAVHKIVGPGNAFVAEAKRQLFGRVGIDAIAGPSEVLIVADDSANPERIAADLIAQAEHDPGSAILVTPSAKLIAAVQTALETQIKTLTRSEAIVRCLADYGALIRCQDLSEACQIAERFATEHLQIQTKDNAWCLSQIRHAGAIFLGSDTCVPFGDYWAGPSHVLPTAGTARFSSALSCNDFRTASSLISYDAGAAKEDAPKVADFAKREGLTAHASAAMARCR